MAARPFGLFPPRRQLLGGFKGLVGQAAIEQPLQELPVERQPLALEIGSMLADLRGVGIGGLRVRTFVPRNPQPLQVLYDLARAFRRGAELVRVFHAQ